MISGFSNASNSHVVHHLAHDSAMPMPFKIPIVLETLLDEDLDLDYDQKQKDLLDALRYSFNARVAMIKKVSIRESELLHQMTQAGQDTEKLKDEYADLQTDKMQASEMFFDIMNTFADLLNAQQYEKLLQAAGVSI